MKLKSLHPKCIFIETYPKALVQTFENHKEFYLKKEKINSKAITKIEQEIPFKLKQSIKSWHQFDAILAWLSGYRYSKNLHQTIGNPKEGLIIF